MNNLKIFYPIIQLTDNHQMLSSKPAERFFPHLIVPSVVEVINNTDYNTIAEVQFPKHNETDIVSVDFLHDIESPEVTLLTKQVKEQNSGRSKCWN